MKTGSEPLDARERRRQARRACREPVSIVIGPGTLVFCWLENLSEGGMCLQLPPRFRVDRGEALVIEEMSALGAPRYANVVAASSTRCHCSFLSPTRSGA
jgi:hypothetical protein